MTASIEKFNPEWSKLSKVLEFSKLANQSKNTLKSYKYNLWDFCKFISIKLQNPIDDKKDKLDETARLLNFLYSKDDLTIKFHIVEYLSDLIKKGQSTSTVAAKLAAIKDYVSITPRSNERLNERLNIDDIKAPKIQKKKVKGPSIEEFEKILKEVEILFDKGNYKDKRDALLFYIENFCGLRISEVLSIDIENLFLKEGVMLIVRKGCPEKVEISIPPITKLKIEEFLKLDKRKKGPLITNCDTHKKGRLSRQGAWQIYVDLTEKCVGRRISPHKFRHFYATEAWELSGQNKDIAKKFTGHKSDKIFEDYKEERENHHLKIATDLEKKWIKND